jgi:hypothetical protein
MLDGARFLQIPLPPSYVFMPAGSRAQLPLTSVVDALPALFMRRTLTVVLTFCGGYCCWRLPGLMPVHAGYARTSSALGLSTIAFAHLSDRQQPVAFHD